jgi:phenylalanyl-tRNA synthetase beta chain
MKISPDWVREFVELAVDDNRLAEDLTAVGVAVEGISGSGPDTIFEMEIGTNRPDAMNHYGVAREAAAIYDSPLKPIEPRLPSGAKAPSSAALRGAAGSRALSKQSSASPNGAAESPALSKQTSASSNGAAESRALSKQTSAASHAAGESRALSKQSSASSYGVAEAAPSSGAHGTTEVVLFPAVLFPITVEEPQLCPRFSARVIRGTTIKASQEKIARRLRLLDQRPISNAVDATNYVLWEIGKPTHVFDMDLLDGGRIIVRKARDGEHLKTLDGVERKLTSEDLVVADAKKPVGLAGVMGGFDTMITEKTRNILIESAWWDPVTIRKTSRRHGIHTDASHRFERGADFESTVLSCDRVAELILESGGGELAGDVIDVVSRKIDQAPIVLRISEVQRILGASIDAGEIFRILKKLGFTLIPEGQDDAQFRVHIPSWRLDVEREIDLIEEIARLHGYDKFENTLPAYSGAVIELPDAAKDATVRQRALALGYNEAVSLTFISHADAERFSSSASAGVKVLELENPLSEEASVMRTTMVPGMLDMLAWNLNHDSENVRLFEMGHVYEAGASQGVEPRRACLGATLAAVKAVLPASAVLDVSKGESAAAVEVFRCFKGDIENLLTAFACERLTFDRQTADYYHPGRSARALVDGVLVAQFGQIHPGVAAERKLRQDVFLAELDLEQLYPRGLRQVRFSPLPRYPAVQRDFSFIFADSVSFEEMEKAVAAVRVPELRDFRPVEIFRGGSIEAGKYSILLRATFQSSERTLREDEVAQWSGKIVAALQGLGGLQRA